MALYHTCKVLYKLTHKYLKSVLVLAFNLRLISLKFVSPVKGKQPSLPHL